MLEQGAIIGLIGVIAMSLALWTTGDTNLYLPSVQTASVFKRPQRVTTVICGLLGTILGLGVYQHFLSWIGLLAALVPPIIGPVIVDFYLVNKARYRAEDLNRLPAWNPIAIAAYAVGATAAFMSTKGIELPGVTWIFPSLLGLLVSMLAYLVLTYVFSAVGLRFGFAKISSSES
jgi:cytosine permease